jgi:hypothetical protein
MTWPFAQVLRRDPEAQTAETGGSVIEMGEAEYMVPTGMWTNCPRLASTC